MSDPNTPDNLTTPAAGGDAGQTAAPVAEAAPASAPDAPESAGQGGQFGGPGGPGGRGPGGPGGRGRGPGGPGGRGRGPGGRRDGRGDRDRDRDEGGLEDRVVTGSIRRCAAVVKGGRRFSFSALVVVGDRNGQVGVGFGKANEVPPAVEKAKKDAQKQLKRVSLEGGTIPHPVQGRFGSSLVRLLPASPGTGVIAGSSARAVLELAGVRDVLTKSYGSTNVINLVKATLVALEKLRNRDLVEKLRGMPVNKVVKGKVG